MLLSRLESVQFRYLIGGIWNSIFGIVLFGILLLLLEDRIGYLGVLTISMPISITQSHYVQRKFVWSTSSNYKQELMRFSLVYALQYFLNLALLWTAVEFLEFEVFYSQLVIVGFLIVASYLLNKKWTFSR
jgi:putative flippase GtrA